MVASAFKLSNGDVTHAECLVAAWLDAVELSKALRIRLPAAISYGALSNFLHGIRVRSPLHIALLS